MSNPSSYSINKSVCSFLNTENNYLMENNLRCYGNEFNNGVEDISTKLIGIWCSNQKMLLMQYLNMK